MVYSMQNDRIWSSCFYVKALLLKIFKLYPKKIKPPKKGWFDTDGRHRLVNGYQSALALR